MKLSAVLHPIPYKDMVESLERNGMFGVHKANIPNTNYYIHLYSLNREVSSIGRDIRMIHAIIFARTSSDDAQTIMAIDVPCNIDGFKLIENWFETVYKYIND